MHHLFEFDDVWLQPTHESTLASRREACTDVDLFGINLEVPIISAPMRDVCDRYMAMELCTLGAFGIVHRFQPYLDQVPIDPRWCAVAIGVTGDWETRLGQLYTLGCRYFCVDTANGINTYVQSVLRRINALSGTFTIAGNVGTAEAFRTLEDWGADAIRVGIAGGSVCETKTETGVYCPTASAVRECALVAQSALVIADGGIRTPADMAKAIGLGADVVMLGGALAGTLEAPGRVIVVDGKKYKIMTGSASYSVQQDNGVENPTYVEGRETLVPYSGPVAEIIARFKHGLQSAMSYMDARTLDEFRAKAVFAKRYVSFDS